MTYWNAFFTLCRQSKCKFYSNWAHFPAFDAMSINIPLVRTVKSLIAIMLEAGMPPWLGARSADSNFSLKPWPLGFWPVS